jgi:hypothetical protein
MRASGMLRAGMRMKRRVVSRGVGMGTRPFSSGGSPSTSEREKDAALLAEYREENPIAFLFTSKGLEQHIKNFDKRIISQVQLFNGVATTWALMNPLLMKYEFDAEDTLTGAEQCLRSVTRALVSRDLFNYATDINVTRSPNAEFLSSVLNPVLYHSVLSSLRANKYENLPFRKLPAEAVIHKSYITDVHTMLVDEDLIKESNATNESIAGIADSEFTAPEGLPEGATVDLGWEKTTRARTYMSPERDLEGGGGVVAPEVLMMPEYPEGSVLAMIKVRFECEFTIGEEEEEAGAGAGAAASTGKSNSHNNVRNSVATTAGDVEEGIDALEPPTDSSVRQEHEQEGGNQDIDETASPEVVADTATTALSSSLGEDKEWAALPDEEKVLAAGMSGTRTLEWVLVGCISGQVPLEYHIASFGGGWTASG